MKKNRIKNSKNLLKTFLIVGTFIIGGYFLKNPPPSTFKTFLHSDEPVIYANKCKDNLTNILSQAIDAADQDVFLRIYNLSSSEILNSLSKQINAQHQVSIHYQSCKDLKKLKKSPNFIAVEHPQEGRKLMHQKALAIDHKYAWLGSANFTNTSFCKDSNIVIGLKSKELCEAIIHDASTSFTVHNQPAQYFSLPNDNQLALNALLDRIRSAKQSIQIAMFALTYSPILQELHLAQQRGVTVEIILDKEFKSICVQQIQAIPGCYIPIRYKITPYKLHYKFAIIDQTTLIAGSVNWSENGFCLNAEDMLILDQLTHKQQKKLKCIWKNLQAESDPISYSSTPPCYDEATEKKAA